MKSKVFILISLFFLIGRSLSSYSQVTIGLGESPEKYAILQVKDKTRESSDPLDAATADKGGILLPRVELHKKNQLLPFVTQDIVDANNQDYQDAKLIHTGLIVYNLIENDDEELCLGLNQWDGEKWNCFQSKLGNAVATLGNCDSLTFVGHYQNNVALTSSNYMTIPLHVQKAGAYTVTAMPDPDNGYYFTASGVFLTVGYYYLTIPGTGMPIDYTPESSNGDLIKITFNDKSLETCDPLFIKVEDSSKKPLYTMDCSSVNVRGVYEIDRPLNNTNFIELTLKADIEAVGSTYIIETNTVDGIYFKDSGLITSISQPVKLMGYGMPASLVDKELTITSNSTKSVATCNAKVVMVIPKKRIYTIGHDAGFGYNLAAGGGARKVLTAPANFGTNESSIVKTDMGNYTFVVSGITGDVANGAVQQIKDELVNNKPDILYITQDAYITEANGLAASIIDYLNKGGVVVCIWEANPYLNGGAQILFRRLFGNQSIKQMKGLGAGGGSIYTFTNVNDEILNGPFGDVRGKYWGEDASWSMTLSNLPVGDIDIYSYATDYAKTGTTAETPDPNNVIAFKHKTLNLIYVGDGGFTSSPSGVPGGNTLICPFYWNTSTMAPIAKTGYGAGTAKYDVYNSQMWCNIMAWAIKQAQFNGINTIK